MAIIYGIRANDSAFYFYVGSTKFTKEHRLSQHLDTIQRGLNKNKHFVSKVTKIGADNLVIDTLEECGELDRWNLEDKWIQSLKAKGHKLTNIALNGHYNTVQQYETYFDEFELQLYHLEYMADILEGKVSANGDWLHDSLLEVLTGLIEHLVKNYPDDLLRTIEDICNGRTDRQTTSIRERILKVLERHRSS